MLSDIMRSRARPGPPAARPAPTATPGPATPSPWAEDLRSAWRPEEQPREQEPGPGGQSPAAGDLDEQDPGGLTPL
jgi:hypothetical protein